MRRKPIFAPNSPEMALRNANFGLHRDFFLASRLGSVRILNWAELGGPIVSGLRRHRAIERQYVTPQVAFGFFISQPKRLRSRIHAKAIRMTGYMKAISIHIRFQIQNTKWLELLSEKRKMLTSRIQTMRVTTQIPDSLIQLFQRPLPQ